MSLERLVNYFFTLHKHLSSGQKIQIQQFHVLHLSTLHIVLFFISCKFKRMQLRDFDIAKKQLRESRDLRVLQYFYLSAHQKILKWFLISLEQETIQLWKSTMKSMPPIALSKTLSQLLLLIFTSYLLLLILF